MLQLTRSWGAGFVGDVSDDADVRNAAPMKVLHVEDDPQDAELIRQAIAEHWPSAVVTCVSDRDDLARELGKQTFDIILSDFSLPGFDGLEALRLAKQQAPTTPFIFVSGTIGEDHAIEAVRQGADDYVLKDRGKRLLMAIPRALQAAAERRERQSAEARSRELANALDQAREAIIVTDLAGRITFWNLGAERLARRTAAEALGRTAAELFDASTVSQLTALCANAGLSGEWSGEITALLENAVRNIEIRVTLIRNDDGAAKARLVLANDVTERKTAERRVREQADMLNQAHDAIYITDLAGHIIYWNAGAERMLGWSAANALFARVDDLIDTGPGAAVSNARAKTVADGQWSGELRLQNRRGEPVTVESRQTLIRDDGGQPKACLCIGTDVTERKRLQEQFLRAQRLENLGLLAAGIAHDLNNMLAPILLATPMLRDHVSDATAVKLLDTLEKSAERGALLVRQILSFANGAGGESQVVQVKHLLRDIIDVIHGTFPKSIRLDDYVPSELWPITGNPTQIHQVLLNLSVNARDAMPEGGTLSLRADNRVLDIDAAAAIPGARPGHFLVIEVADTGMGIAPEILERIWEPFFTTKEAGRGSGLGLSTVRGIIQAHHGFMEVKSVVNRGSVFRLFLPAAEGSEQPAAGPGARVLPRGKGELILVVDDEQQIREMMSQMLGRHGYRVIVAPDGVEAAAVFAQRAAEIRLVISDLHMPNLDGATLGRVLRQISPSAKMLVVSGMTGGLGNRNDFKPEEFSDALLMKPFKGETLLETVHDLLSGAPQTPFAIR